MSKLQLEQEWLRTGSLVLLATVAAGWALFHTRMVMMPFVLALFVYCSVSPVMDVLVLRFRFPRYAAVFVTLLVVLGFLALFGFVLAASAQVMLETTDRYEDRLQLLLQSVTGYLERYDVGLGEGPLLSRFKDEMYSALRTAAEAITTLVSSGFLAIVFVTFFLAGREPKKDNARLYRDMDQKIRRYIVIKTVMSAMTGLVVWMILDLFGLELAMVFGILTFVLNFIPSVGACIATLLPLPVALAQFHADPLTVALVILIPGALQIMIGNFVEPKLLGKGLELHPVTVIVALAFWGLLWKAPGMILAAPMTAAVRIIFMQFETTRPAGELLSGKLPVPGLETSDEDSPAG